MAEKDNHGNENKKPIFKKPYGASEGKHTFGISGTDGPILCELCGTVHKKRSDNYSYSWGIIFSRQFVEECCGKFVEELYDQFGSAFTEAFLEDFAEDPTGQDFAYLRFILPGILKKVRAKTAEISFVVANQ